jgi:hypothetical protein
MRYCIDVEGVAQRYHPKEILDILDLRLLSRLLPNINPEAS